MNHQLRKRDGDGRRGRKEKTQKEVRDGPLTRDLFPTLLSLHENSCTTTTTEGTPFIVVHPEESRVPLESPPGYPLRHDARLSIPVAYETNWGIKDGCRQVGCRRMTPSGERNSPVRQPNHGSPIRFVLKKGPLSEPGVFYGIGPVCFMSLPSPPYVTRGKGRGECGSVTRGQESPEIVLLCR